MQKLFFTAKAKKRLFLVGAMLPILLLFFIFVQVTELLATIIFIVYAILAMILIPFVVDVSSVEEPLW
jgi:hypothetical protein